MTPPGTTLAISQVQSWRPEALAAAADGAGTLHRSLDDALRALVDSEGRMNWRGRAGDTAASRIGAERTRAGEVSAAVTTVEGALRQFVPDLQNTRKAVLDARNRAVQAGFEVADDGAVTAAAKVKQLHDAGTPADDRAFTQLAGEVAAAHNEIVQALAQAAAAAGRVATALGTALVKATALPPLPAPSPGVVSAVAVAPYSHGPTDYSSRGGTTTHGYGPSGGPPAGAMPTGEKAEWIARALEILQAEGIDISKISPADIAAIIDHESGGNPHAINLWDSNAAAGHPSKGIMQCIDSTFSAYKIPGHDDIWNPVDNICAAVRYSISRYGSVEDVPGISAMRTGGSYVGY